MSLPPMFFNLPNFFVDRPSLYSLAEAFVNMNLKVFIPVKPSLYKGNIACGNRNSKAYYRLENK